MDKNFFTQEEKAKYFDEIASHFYERNILIVSDSCTVEYEIKIVFSSTELADTFQGLIFSWE